MTLGKKAIAEVKALEDRKGRLTPAQVVEAAKNKQSALHRCFQWDDTKAAASYRLQQAGEVIRQVRLVIVVEEREVSVSNYVRDPNRPASVQGSINITKVKPVDILEVLKTEVDNIEILINRTLGIASAHKDNVSDSFGMVLTTLLVDLDTARTYLEK